MSFVKFHSKAGGAFFFLPETQKQVFKLLGRPCTESGAIAPEEAAEWIRILDAAVERDKRERKAQEEDRREESPRVPGKGPARGEALG